MTPFSNAILIAAALAAEPGSGAIRVDVSGLRMASGMLRAQAVDEAGRTHAAAAAPAGAAAIILRGLAPGRYAVRLYHDVDGDGRMARGPLGLPREPYGFSRDGRVGLGPPPFAAIALDVPAGRTVSTHATLRQ